MGTNTLTDKTDPHGIAATDWNEIHTSMAGDFVGRQKTGGSSAATSGQNLGTPVVPWGNMYTNNLYIGGTLIDFSAFVLTNKIISGATRSASIQPDFIRANGAATSFQVLGATTNLVYNVGTTGATISTDITVSGLTVAPATNNTCLVNDTALIDQDSSKYQGEFGTTITVDAMGSEITGRIGQYVALKHGTSEIMFAYVESATELTNIRRGFFFDSSGNPLERETMADNDTLTLYELAWVFAEDNGTTVDVTYTTPVNSFTEPASPATDDYWFDMTNNVWKRYDGAVWQTINRLLIGSAVIDTTNCIATRSFDFGATYLDHIDCDAEFVDVTTIKTKKKFARLSVYANEIIFDQTGLLWDMATDIESGQTESVSTVFYIYVTEKGEPILSKTSPYDRREDLKGYYHPYHSWRCVGSLYNDSSSDIENVFLSPKISPDCVKHTDFIATGTFIAPVGITELEVEVIGSGGGGNGGGDGGANGGYARETLSITPLIAVAVTVAIGGAINGNGGTSSFGVFLSATGGLGGLFPTGVATGGVGVGEDVTMQGSFNFGVTGGGGYRHTTGGGNVRGFGNGGDRAQVGKDGFVRVKY